MKWALIMTSFLIGLFLFSLDNTIVADVQPAIVDAFQSVGKITWLATGFFLPTVGISPLPTYLTKRLCSPVWTVWHDISSKMVLYCQRHYL
jgi:hypothetical protein